MCKLWIHWLQKLKKPQKFLKPRFQSVLQKSCTRKNDKLCKHSLIGPPTAIYIITSLNSPGCYMVLSWWGGGILESLSAAPVCWCLWRAQVRRAPKDLLFTVFLASQEAVQCSKVRYPITADCMKTTRNCHTKDNATHNKNIGSKDN